MRARAGWPGSFIETAGRPGRRPRASVGAASRAATRRARSSRTTGRLALATADGRLVLDEVQLAGPAGDDRRGAPARPAGASSARRSSSAAGPAASRRAHRGGADDVGRRRAAPASGRACQGPRRDPLRRGPPHPRAPARPPRAGAAGPRADRLASTRRPRSPRPASSRCSPPRDLPIMARGQRPAAPAARAVRGGLRGPAGRARRRADPGSRRGRRGAGRRRPRGRCRRSSSRRPRWSPARRSPGSTSPRRATGPARWTPRPTPASAAAATTRSTPRTCRRTSRAATATATATSPRRSRGGGGRARAASRPSGSTRATSSRRPAPPGSTRTARSCSRPRRSRCSGRATRSRRRSAAAAAGPGGGDAARRRVRRQVAAVRHARRRGRRGKLRRPVRLAAHAIRGLRRREPGPAVHDDAPDRRGRDGPVHRRSRRRVVADAGAFEEGSARVARRRARRRAVRVAGVRHQGLRRADEPVRRRRLPRADRRRRWPSRSRRSIDELAAELDIDPIELRRRNLAAEGSPMVDGETWPAHGARGGPRRARGEPGLARSARRRPGRTRASGVALGYWPGATNPAAAACRMSPDGSVQVMTGVADMSGRGRRVPGDRRRRRSASRPDLVQVADARFRRGAGVAGQRRQHDHVLGRARDPAGGRGDGAAAARGGGAPARDRRRGPGARRRRRPAAGHARSARSRSRRSSAATPAPAGRRSRATAGAEQPSLAPSVSGHVVRVRVDRETGAVTVLEDHVVQDVGRVLNPALVAGQQHGAAAQGIGWATLEALVHDEDGQLLSGHVPGLRAAARRGRRRGWRRRSVEVPAPDGPLGAKGIGEAPVIAGAAAIANAVAAATGVRLRELPMTRPAGLARAHDAADGRGRRDEAPRLAMACRSSSQAARSAPGPVRARPTRRSRHGSAERGEPALPGAAAPDSAVARQRATAAPT